MTTRRSMPWQLVLPSVLLTSMLTACVVTNPSSIGGSENLTEAADANFNLGIGYLRQGKWELAQQKLEKSVDQDGAVPAAHSALALVYENLGKYKGAETHYSRAVKLAPDDASAQNSYGVFLCRRQQRPQDAQKYFQAAANNPRYATPEAALTNAGVCMLQLPNVEAAEGYFRQALERNPRYIDALLQMTTIAFDAEKFMQARAFLERSEAVTPSSPSLLWRGYQIETRLGDEKRANVYALRLKDRYPDSTQSRELIELERNER
jgi:type IV pilus assembly protein PilF